MAENVNQFRRNFSFLRLNRSLKNEIGEDICRAVAKKDARCSSKIESFLGSNSLDLAIAHVRIRRCFDSSNRHFFFTPNLVDNQYRGVLKVAIFREFTSNLIRPKSRLGHYRVVIKNF